jgi:Na+/melibiose symporter-like transporter
VVTLIACSALFAWLPAYTALLIQYAIALVGSTLSYFSLRRLPDTEKPTAISLASVLRDTPRHVVAASTFRTYLWLAVLFNVISTPISPFAAYYLKVGPKLAASQIMIFEICRFCGVISVAGFMRSRIEHYGAKPFLILSAALHMAIAVYWWMFLRQGWPTLLPMYFVYFFVGVSASAWTSANLGYLPKITPAAERTLMVAIHGAAWSFLGGLSPVLWGLFLKRGGSSGLDIPVFQWFFVSVFLGALFLIWRVARLPEKAAAEAPLLLLGGDLLRPLRAVTSLVTLVQPTAKPDKTPPKKIPDEPS